MRTAGIASGPHATPKGLRHGFGLHAILSGVPINLVQKWLGHASLSTTPIYLEAVGSEERELAARMWALTTCRMRMACPGAETRNRFRNNALATRALFGPSRCASKVRTAAAGM
ncbi:MAG: tyrosine-type recombinase/integrase [Hyphomicrobiaceae bacterium]